MRSPSTPAGPSSLSSGAYGRSATSRGATLYFSTASSILLGFLFTGSWWALNRELRFRDDRRHFKLGYCLLLFSIGTLALAGVIMPLSIAVRGHPELAFSFGPCAPLTSRSTGLATPLRGAARGR